MRSWPISSGPGNKESGQDMNKKKNIKKAEAIWNAFRLVLCCMIAVWLCTVCGCGSTTVQEDDSLQKVLDRGQLVVGLDMDFPPMGFTDESGAITGFDMDVAQEVCDRLGVELVKQPVDWDRKEACLDDGTIDCIWNGLSATPDRAQMMELTDPYMKNELIFVVPGSSEARMSSNLDGGTVGVQSGSTAQALLERSEEFEDIRVVPQRDYPALLK